MARHFALSAALVLLAIFTVACGHKKRVAVAPPPVARVAKAPAPILDGETGIASWYGHPYHGRRAADGEIYDMEQMVAAHRTLPFQTRVRVENLDNGRSAEVRIIDRGPFVDGRIIDLSHAAAAQLAVIGPGTAHVRLHLLSPAALQPGVYAVQVGAFANRENAERLQAQMQQRFGTARIVRREGQAVLWRVLAGAAPSVAEAEALRASLDQTSFVVRIDDPPAH